MYRCEFAPGRGEARLRKLEKGCIRVYEQPGPDGKYAIGADTATGRGLDYSAGFVIDLATMAPVAEVHGKLDPDVTPPNSTSSAAGTPPPGSPSSPPAASANR